jgi:hypothetical protein
LTATPTEDEQKALDAWETTNTEWISNDAIIKQGIAAMIPDSLFLKVMGETTAKGMWTKVKQEFEQRSQMLKVDLRRKLQEKKCAEGEDVKTHLDELQWLREDLIAIGADPGDENFVAIVMGSLPASLDPYLAALTATTSLLDKTLTPEVILRGIRDEAERRNLQKSSGKSKDNVAFTAREQKKDKKNIECYNCHKKGHMKSECWAKGGGQEGKGPKGKGRGKGKKGESNVVEGKDADELWVMERRREGHEEDSEWGDMVEINLGGWWTPEQTMESGLEGLSSLYTHDNILWDNDKPKDDNIESQDVPYGPNLPSDPSTPTQTHSGATSTPSVNYDDLSVILDESEGTPDAQEISLAEVDMNVTLTLTYQPSTTSQTLSLKTGILSSRERAPTRRLIVYRT